MMTDDQKARVQSAIRCASRAAVSLALTDGPKDARYHIATALYDLTTLLQEAEDAYPMPGHRHYVGGYLVRDAAGNAVGTEPSLGELVERARLEAIAIAAGRVA